MPRLLEMPRLLALAPPAAIALAALATIGATAGAQDARPQVSFDTAARGRRDGLMAADTTSISGYIVLGALTGFVAGVVGPPVWAHNNSRSAGALTLIPFAWTVVAAGRKSRAAPPPELATRIDSQPASYQEAFRASYAQRLAQRRRRATIISGVTATLVGVATFVALVIAALGTAGT